MKRKLQLFDMIRAGVDYIAYQRVKDQAGNMGYRYILDKPLSAEQKEYIIGFQNVIVSSAAYKYAPEIKHDVIILLDKCRKPVNI